MIHNSVQNDNEEPVYQEDFIDQVGEMIDVVGELVFIILLKLHFQKIVCI